jgi:hypothetical protein
MGAVIRAKPAVRKLVSPRAEKNFVLLVDLAQLVAYTPAGTRLGRCQFYQAIEVAHDRTFPTYGIDIGFVDNRFLWISE